MVTWRIVTWNLLGSRGLLTDRVAGVLEDLRPDAVALQEVQHRQVRRLAHRLGWNHHWTVKHYPYSPLVWWRAEGLAILTPHSLTGDAHAVISRGVSNWTYRHRVVIAATVGRADDTLRLFNTHLGDSAADRVPQAERLARFVAAERSAASGSEDIAPETVVAGDFNASDDPDTFRPLYTLGLSDPGGTNTSTALDPHQRIDYVLVPSSAVVNHRLTPSGGSWWNELSDHLPVLVEFDLVDPARFRRTR
jgi:endonuclease/exonuclease/phosphatase family metal-dependent hydrolase